MDSGEEGSGCSAMAARALISASSCAQMETKSDALTGLLCCRLPRRVLVLNASMPGCSCSERARAACQGTR
eukprot:5370177-Alexandrium_andersonii.AAC.1